MSDNSSGNEQHAEQKKRNIFLDTYDKHYKPLLIFSVLLLAFSIFVIAYQYATTGDFVAKGVTLKGGLTLTITTQNVIKDSDALERSLRATYPKSDINVRTFVVGSQHGLIVEASDLDAQQIMAELSPKIGPVLAQSSTNDGPSLGSAFFTQTLKALFIAFIFMSLVIYLYFGESLKLKWLTGAFSIVAALMMFYASSVIFYMLPLVILAILLVIYFRDNIPSFGIMLCALSDILFSLAVFNLFGLKLNIAGVAAFLMLVGYSIDTDILLSVRVLKRKEGTVFDRTIGAMKTGMMMSFAALIAALTAYFLSQSAVIKEIMFILAVGLVGDIIFTWIQNAGILRWHLENKGWK